MFVVGCRLQVVSKNDLQQTTQNPQPAKKTMNNQDPIADMLTRIRNANRVGRRLVLIPKSKICTGIAQVLKDEGYIETYDQVDDGQQGQIRVKLKYSMTGEKVIHAI